MSALLPLLRPLAVRQGERTIGQLPEIPEPDGPPHGLIPGPRPRRSLVVMGDESALGVGGLPRDEGFPGLVAGAIAGRVRAEVLWQCLGERGATAEALHHRLVPQLPSCDVAVVMLGTHDLLARTSRDEWRDELSASLRLVTGRAARTVVVGCPRLGRTPLVPWPLSASLDRDASRLDQVTRGLCDELGAGFVDQSALAAEHAPVGDRWFAPDNFHPGREQYRALAKTVIAAL